ncbi:hypothetical protein [Halomonas sp. DWK9]|uniref:hypothetical protein n=1 Tax=Halomonadaceae TaxID=28256 RepID=UPI00287F9AF3|nr:hypothetical protein [Halomonas sp. DWK9]
MSPYFLRHPSIDLTRRGVLKGLFFSTGAVLTLSRWPVAAAQPAPIPAPVLVNGWLLRAEDR